jgi:hypothetical protein
MVARRKTGWSNIMTITLEFARSTKLAATLCSMLILGGCLTGESEDSSFTDPGPGPSENSAPQISGTPATSIAEGQQYSFTPTAADADGDSLSFSISGQPSWADFDSSTGAITGSPGPGDVGVFANIVVSVSDGEDTASLPAFSITVNAISLGSVTLSWTAPTHNEDASVIEDLAGFKIYWGTTPGSYGNSVTIDNPSVSTFVVENLAPGTYEFVATAYNEAGVESRFSGTATKVIQ